MGELLEQLDLDLLNLEEAVVLLPEQMIEFFVQVPDLQFRFQINFVVIIGMETIMRCGPVLTHHDDGRLERGETGEDQVQKDKRVWIPGARQKNGTIDDDPDDEDGTESNDESPAPTKLRDPIGKRFSEG